MNKSSPLDRPNEFGNDEIVCLAAITLPTRDMGRAVQFYQSLGFEINFGGTESAFTTLVAGTAHVNLRLIDQVDETTSRQSRVIFHVADVDAFYRRIQAAGWTADAAPADADWGERYFHISDLDRNGLSFARPIE